MDEILYSSLSRYYNVLSKTGYMSSSHAMKLLVLAFYRDFVFNDYRGFIKKSDYYLIEKALNCLYGSTCLIPYPDYLKMGKLRLGEISEMACRIKAMENADVVKVIHDTKVINADTDSDVIITMEEVEVTNNTPTNPITPETNQGEENQEHPAPTDDQTATNTGNTGNNEVFGL